MGIIDRIEGNRVYLDANIFIYAQEQLEPYAALLGDLFERIESGDLHSITSELTLGECLVKPIADGDTDLVNIYQETFISDETLTVVPITRSLIVRAAELRATRPLRLPDALHASTAIEGHCTTLLTNDAKFRSLTELKVVVLSEAINAP
jgi:predicted nucleic acid-binding protein